MDSWTARKRPWEDERQIDPLSDRSDPIAGSGVGQHAPPLPQHAGKASSDSHSLSQRKLPPLSTVSCSALVEPTLATSFKLSSQAHEHPGSARSESRAHSVLDIFHQPKRPRLESIPAKTKDILERTVALSSAHDLDRSLRPIIDDAGRSRFGTELAPHTTEAVNCCPSNCGGQACPNVRALMRRLASELISLNSTFRSILRNDYPPSHELPDFENSNTRDSLQWCLDLVQWSNHYLRGHIDRSLSLSPANSSSHFDPPTSMRRGHNAAEREERSPSARHFSNPLYDYSAFPHPSALAEEARKTFANETASVGSPHQTTSSSGSIFMPPQSPLQAPQALRSTMLPSPSSMNFPNVTNLPPVSPPSASAHTSAQAAHLQELQHQVSVKTLAFQTLQREYDSLLQKLERQRTKCATLEKKFEVSDVEINSLTDEKEKLQGQVAVLEHQVEELQQSRDEARRQLGSQGSQYMQIMEMANRLQAQSSNDKKRWETERLDLEQRIRALEEAMVVGQSEETSLATREGDRPPHVNTSLSLPLAHGRHASGALYASTGETINVLRAEIGRLRSRTQMLETALQSMKEESLTIQTAARQLVGSGGRIEKIVEGSMSG